MIEYRDLLRLKAYRLGGRDPATGVDCWWLAMEVARRAGRALPDAVELAEAACADEVAWRGALWPRLEAFGVRFVAEGWQSSIVGDLLLCLPDEAGAPAHVASVVSRAPDWCLHARRRVGVVGCAPWRLPKLLGTWRAAAAA